MTRRTHLFLISCLIFLISYFFLPFPAQAKDDCNQIPTSNDGPQYYIPNTDNKCSVPTPEREIEELKTASVTCIDNPQLVAQAINFEKEYLSQFLPKLVGSSEIKFVSYDSFGINTDSLNQIDTDQTGILTKIAKAVSLPDYFDTSLTDALCVYEGHLDRTECAKVLQNQQPSQRENLLISGGWWQFANTIQSQFEAKKERAAEIVACANDNNGPLTPCDQPYVVSKTPQVISLFNAGELTSSNQVTSIDLAKKILTLDYQEFSTLSPELKMTILSLRESRAYSGVYLVVRKKDGPTSIFVVNLLTLLGFDESDIEGPPNPNLKTVIQTGYIPGVHKTTARATELYQLLNTKAVGDQGLSQITSKLTTDYSYDDSKSLDDQRTELIIKKIVQNGGNCSPPSNLDYQTSGSQEKYRLTEGLGSFIGINIDVKAPWEKALEENIENLYEAYLIAPTEILAEVMAQDEQAPFPMMVKKEYQDSAQSKTFIPQTLSEKPPSASQTRALTKIKTVPCPTNGSIIPNEDGLCYGTYSEDGTIEYSGGGNVEGPLPGGEATNWLLYLKGKFAWKKGTPAHFAGNCYADETAAKVDSSLLASLGTTLFSLIGRTDNSANRQCPDDFTAAKTPSPLSDDICAVAAAYNIDCGLMKAIYEIETGSGTNIPTYTYGNLNCCNSSDFCGPMQVGGGIVGTISPDRERDVCTTPDAFELAARWLLIKKWCNLNASTCLGSSDPYEWKENYINEQGVSSLSSSPNERKTQVEEFIIGWYGSIYPDSATISRWGPGKSYVDAVLYFLDNCMTSAPGQCAFFQ